MMSVDELKPASLADEGVSVDRVVECPPSFYRYLYSEVGRNYHWVERLSWTDEQIHAYLSKPSISLWVLYCGGAPGGYFELRQNEDGSVEIVYLGLLKEFMGRGLGKYLLTIAVEQAWNKATNRIWVHTSTLDHPAALSNYIKRGFKPLRQETYVLSEESGE
jgi:GNAT superfamily N-acetyltransferase